MLHLLAGLPVLSEDTLKMDVFVGGVAKKIEKTYYEVWKTEAAEVAANKERAAAAAATAQAASSSSAAAAKEEKAPELRIENSQWDTMRADNAQWALPIL